MTNIPNSRYFVDSSQGRFTVQLFQRLRKSFIHFISYIWDIYKPVSDVNTSQYRWENSCKTCRRQGLAILHFRSPFCRRNREHVMFPHRLQCIFRVKIHDVTKSVHSMLSRLNKHQRNVLIRSLSMLQGSQVLTLCTHARLSIISAVRVAFYCSCSSSERLCWNVL